MAYQGGLRRWFKEKWVNTQTGGKCGEGGSVAKTGKYCRPSVRVNSKTPVTVSELSKSELRKIKRQKRSKRNAGKKPDRVKSIRKIRRNG